MNYAIPTFSKISTFKLFIIPTQMRFIDIEIMIYSNIQMSMLSIIS